MTGGDIRQGIPSVSAVLKSLGHLPLRQMTMIRLIQIGIFGATLKLHFLALDLLCDLH